MGKSQLSVVSSQFSQENKSLGTIRIRVTVAQVSLTTKGTKVHEGENPKAWWLTHFAGMVLLSAECSLTEQLAAANYFTVVYFADMPWR
jgi:hypothetical protein